ncbi:Protein plastid transcriptionally active 14 [Rhynchospora pubera]|uniref:Protein plastid transcriptionally active 14 n=1 Tax=Rhynchospora pubera TaxID=906938 RepID=A0AAV8HER4_9POAL|nr:Protein plastid transcriptionally active 14 [Rhynchospora pubera]
MASAASLLLPFPSHFSIGTRKFHNDAAFISPLRKRRLQIRASVTATAPRGLKLSEPEPLLPEIQPADPDFYRIGYMRNMRAYGVEFMEGPDGFGVYASRDVEPLRRARVIMEIPLELMLTISQKKPWMFFPDVIPIGHPIFDIINSTDPETEEDFRLACLLLYGLDVQGHFWQSYGDFLPGTDQCTNLLLASKDDLVELQDPDLSLRIEQHQKRAVEFWEKHWYPAAPLKIRRLARDPERFLWAVSIAQSRAVSMKIRLGALVQNTNLLVPYADMLNHSFQPNCFLHWRFKDRMLEVMINAGQHIKEGDEMTLSYLDGAMNNVLMERYGFSSPVNPWDVIKFSSPAKIHLDTFLSVFNISGLEDNYHHNYKVSSEEDRSFVDGAVIAAARTLPTWSEKDVPIIPSRERKAARELQEECHKILGEFPTTSQQDQLVLDTDASISKTRETAIKYRMHRKLLLEKIIEALDVYQDRLFF